MSHEHKLTAFLCSHVFDEKKPILFVSHEIDGDWQFMCGGTDHNERSQTRLVCFDCVMERHPDVRLLIDLGQGQYAERETGSSREWIVGDLEEAWDEE